MREGSQQEASLILAELQALMETFGMRVELGAGAQRPQRSMHWAQSEPNRAMPLLWALLLAPLGFSVWLYRSLWRGPRQRSAMAMSLRCCSTV